MKAATRRTGKSKTTQSKLSRRAMMRLNSSKKTLGSIYTVPDTRGNSRSSTPMSSNSRDSTPKNSSNRSTPKGKSSTQLPRLGSKSRHSPTKFTFSTKKSTPKPTPKRLSSIDSSLFPSLDTPKRKGESPRKSRAKSPPYTGILPPRRPEHEGRLTVVLDMDETLLHSEFRNPNNYRQAEDRKSVKRKCDFTLSLNTDGSMSETISVYKRPGLHAFLDECSKNFEVVIFTAALPVYASPVLDKIDKKKQIVARLYRDSTVIWKGQPFVKDLVPLGRDMRKIVLVDNNPCAMIARPDNSIPILSFYDDPSDEELGKVLKLLMKLKDMKDVRPFLKRRFRLRENLASLLS